MEEELRCLFLRYGIVEIKNSIEKECRRLYEGLQIFYEGNGKNTRKETVIEQSFEPMITSKISIESNNDCNINIENKEEEIGGGSANILRIIKKMNKNAVVEDIIVPTINPIEDIKYENKEEIEDERERHRRIVAEKHTELLENGIEPMSLLTKDNLEKWLKSGKSYMKIAKETGIDEGEVSRKSREYGMKSLASKYKFYKKGKRLI